MLGRGLLIELRIGLLVCAGFLGRDRRAWNMLTRGGGLVRGLGRRSEFWSVGSGSGFGVLLVLELGLEWRGWCLFGDLAVICDLRAMGSLSFCLPACFVSEMRLWRG